MLSKRHIEEEIRRIRERGGCEDARELAWLYIVHDHMEDAQAHHERERLTMDEACEWVREMEGTDPEKPHGGKWTMDEAWKLARRMGISGEAADMIEFYAVINAMHADYYEVAKKHGVAKPEFFADMACAWMNDADAVEGKAKAYFEHVVK